MQTSANRNYMVRDIGKISYLFVTSGFKLWEEGFKLVYIRNITGVYYDKSAQIGNFIKINIVITIILAVGLYILIWFLTRSIRTLTKSAQKIASGDYSQRVQVLSKDEIGLLSDNFNKMADAIDYRQQYLWITKKSFG